MKKTSAEAREVLGLRGEEEPTPEAVRDAFVKLARRYPEHHFPERFRELREAYDLLLKPDAGFGALLSAPEVDLSVLLPFVSPPETPAELRAGSQAEVLAELLRLVFSEVEQEDDYGIASSSTLEKMFRRLASGGRRI